jgi:HlyD family secretion protein
MKKFAIIVGIIIVIIALISIFGAKSKKGKSKKAETVKAHIVEEGSITVKLEETGEIQPIREIEIKSKVSGKIIKFFLEESDFVKNGDIIASIEPDYNQAEIINRVKSNLELAEIRLTNARRDLKDKQELYQEKYISENELNSYIDALKEAEINYDSALQQYEYLSHCFHCFRNCNSKICRRRGNGSIQHRFIYGWYGNSNSGRSGEDGGKIKD